MTITTINKAWNKVTYGKSRKKVVARLIEVRREGISL